MQITDDTPVAMLTAGQLRDYLGLSAPKTESSSQQQPTQERRFVYGLAGIQSLFNVSHVTAQRYKNTFLAPAVSQQGRTIMVDVEKAITLFSDHYKQSKTL